ncbi:MAG TPA: DUF4870 domain-containing protein [Dehalococcoidia bacterium]|nr:DUF4870 domain-containing protein [Dehalococcoidia bacterium]
MSQKPSVDQPGRDRVHAPSGEECRQAARAHLAAWLGILPLFGLFTAFGIYSQTQRSSPWVAQQALLSTLYQTVAFNLVLIVSALAIAVGFVAWDSGNDGDDLVIAAILTGVPFYLLGWLGQAILATRASRAVLGGADFRYPVIGRLVGTPAPTRGEVEMGQESE